MADNVTLNSMSGGVVVAADDVSSVFFQKIKIALGGDGVEGNLWDGKLVANSGVDIGDVTINNGSGASAVNIQDGGNSITVDGTITVEQTDSSNLQVQVQGVVAAGETDSGNPVKVGGKYALTLPTYTDGQRTELVSDSKGQIRMVLGVLNSTTAHHTGADNSDDVAVSATAAKLQIINRNTVFDGTNWDRMYGDSVNGLDVDVTRMAALVANSGVDIGDVTINNASGGSAVNIQDGGNSITVDNGGTFATQATLQAGSNLVGDVSLQPRTANGCDIFRSLDLDETEEEVKASAGNVFGYYFHNKAATTMWLKFYNATTANVTVGTTTPVMTLGLPAGASGNVGLPYPVSFDTAITVAVTTGIADNDTGAPAANDVSINIFYK